MTRLSRTFRTKDSTITIFLLGRTMTMLPTIKRSSERSSVIIGIAEKKWRRVKVAVQILTYRHSITMVVVVESDCGLSEKCVVPRGLSIGDRVIMKAFSCVPLNDSDCMKRLKILLYCRMYQYRNIPRIEYHYKDKCCFFFVTEIF